MPSLNLCIFMGHLGQDPDIKYKPDGDPVARISLGVSRKWKDKQTNERHEETEWVRAVMFGQRAKFASQYLHKGDAAYIEGRMKTSSWEDREGIKRQSTDIIVNNVQKLTKRSEENAQRPASQTPHQSAYQESFDNDIPF